MNITQSDRDSLRLKQRIINDNPVGNIVEYKTQNPKEYTPSRPTSGRLSLKPYVSKYKEVMSSISETIEPELPISMDDITANHWLNMDQVEFDKLEWMSSKAEKLHGEQMKGKTRFDKDGKVISSDNSNDSGHDIDGLINLLDSQFQPQVTYALIVISKIADYLTASFYDAAFDENLYELLIGKCLLRVRHHLDSTSETICQSALKCLRALICNTHVDEVILDRIHPIVSNQSTDDIFWLLPDEHDKEFTIEMKDIECLAFDAVRTLIERTDILKRFTYLVQTKPDPFVGSYYESIIDILIRFSRHSAGVSGRIIRCGIMEHLIKLCPAQITSADKSAQLVTIKTLKLTRILIQAAVRLKTDADTEFEKIASELPTEHIKNIVSIYFLNEPYVQQSNDTLLKLHIETLRLIRILCNLRDTQSQVVDVMNLGQANICSTLQRLGELKSTSTFDAKISFDWQLAAHIIDLLAAFKRLEKYQAVKNFSESLWMIYVKFYLFQWVRDVTNSKIVPQFDVSVAMVCAIENYKYFSEFTDLQNVMINSIMTEDHISNREDQDFYKLLLNGACDMSQLPNFDKTNGQLRDPKSLPSYGFLCFNPTSENSFKLSPIFEDNSPFLLLGQYFYILKGESKPVTEKHLRFFGDNYHLTRYLGMTNKYHKKPISYESSVQKSFAGQLEAQLIGSGLSLVSRYHTTNIAAHENYNHSSQTNSLGEMIADNFGNLCFKITSLISLLGWRSTPGVQLKSELMNGILFSSNLSTAIRQEASKTDLVAKFKERVDSEKDTYENLTPEDDAILQMTILESMPENSLSILSQLYMNFEQSNRFWILEPIITYYANAIKGQLATKSSNSNEGHWYQNNMQWVQISAELGACSDADLMSMILNYHAYLLEFSPEYLDSVKRYNLCDTICLIGCLFLDDSLFHEERVWRAMCTNLRILFRTCISQKDGKFISPFSSPASVVRPLKLPLADLFNQLIEQFEACSYGNPAFSMYLFMFLSRKSDPWFRRKLIQEKADTCLRQMRIIPHMLWVPWRLLIEDQEKILGSLLVKQSG